MTWSCSGFGRRFAGGCALVVGVVALMAVQPALAYDPLINEFVADHIGSDTNEFIEVYGDPNTNYSIFTVLEIEGDAGSNAGTIDGAWTIGTTDAAGFWTTGFMAGALENGTLTLLLVEGFSGNLGDDIDINDDGVIDFLPFVTIWDDVGTTDSDPLDWVYSASVLGPGFDGNPLKPGGGSRIPNGLDTDATMDWLRNDFAGEGLPGFSGTPVVGEAINTPGIENQEVIAGVDAVINEFLANHIGTDTHEFIEILGEPNRSYGAFQVLEIEGDGAAAGRVDGIFNIGGTDGLGYWTTGFMANELENGTITLLLVEGYTGTFGDDLDLNNDGILDVFPFTRIVDDVAVTDGDPGDQVYSMSVLDPNFDGFGLTPGGGSRIPNGVDTDATADWLRNDFSGAGLPGFTGTPVSGEALNTPGMENQPADLVAVEETTWGRLKALYQ